MGGGRCRFGRRESLRLHGEKNTLGIDLWTNDMLVEDMNLHFVQTFFKMADTYERATKNKEVADKIRVFCQEFARKVELKQKEPE